MYELVSSQRFDFQIENVVRLGCPPWQGRNPRITSVVEVICRDLPMSRFEKRSFPFFESRNSALQQPPRNLDPGRPPSVKEDLVLIAQSDRNSAAISETLLRKEFVYRGPFPCG